jgi:ACT domain-containing protein
MSNIELRNGILINSDDLLQAVNSLDNESLRSLYEKVQDTIKFRQFATQHEEKKVLSAIKSIISASTVRRHKELLKKFESGSITQQEMEELRVITDFIEEKSAERVEMLHQLAQLRNMDLTQLRKIVNLPEIYA